MTKTKKTVIWASIACLCVFAVAGSAIGVTYSMYRSSSFREVNTYIPKWEFDLSKEQDSFSGLSSVVLSPDQSVYTEGNTNRYSVSSPIGISKVINSGEITGDVKASAAISVSNPYTPNDKYVSNSQFENEFFSHFSVDLYYSHYLDSDYGEGFEQTLTPLKEDEYITIYTDKEVEEDSSLYSFLYYYVTVTWISDIDGVNGDGFDTWVARYIEEINISFSFSAVQHEDREVSSPAPEPSVSSARLGGFGTDGIHYYFNGLASGNYLDTSIEWDEAVEVTITDYGEDGAYLSFTDSNNNLKYISYSDSTKVDISDNPFSWYWLEEEQVYATSTDTSNARILVLYEDNHSVRAYQYSTSNLNNNPHIYPYTEEQENIEQQTPDIDIPTPNIDEDDTYKFGTQHDTYTYLWFDGTISSHFLNTTSVWDEAVDVYLTEIPNDDIDNSYTLSFVDDSGNLQYIACQESSSNNTNMDITSDPYVWVLNEDSDNGDYFSTPSFNNRFIGNSTSQTDFRAYGSSNVSSSGYNHVSLFNDEPYVDPEPEPEPGEDYDTEGLLGTFDFSTNTKNGTAISSSSDLDDFWTGDSSLYEGAIDYSSVYLGNGSGGQFANVTTLLKIGTASGAGSIQLKFALGTCISEVVVTAHSWNTSTTNVLTLNGISENTTNSGTASRITYEITDDFTYLVTMETTAAVTVHSIAIYGTYEPDRIEPITSLTLTSDKTELNVGESAHVTVFFEPSSTVLDLDTLTWESNNTSAATVAKTTNGATITAVGSGEAAITATAENGVSGSVSVTINDVLQESETFVSSELGYSNSDTVTAINGHQVTITFAKGSGSSTPAYYTSGTAIRCYTNNTVTFSANYSEAPITSIVITYDGSYNGGTLTYTNCSGETNSSSKTITITPDSGASSDPYITIGSTQLRITQFVINYDL